MTNIFKFIKWNFQEMEAWKYRYMVYFMWIVGASFLTTPLLSVLGLVAMFTDMFICITVDNYQRFKREQDQA